jgi:hypothetical protein
VRTNAKDTGVTYTITGVIEAIDNTKLRITELPIRRWTEDYKKFIESLMPEHEGFIKVAEFTMKYFTKFYDALLVSNFLPSQSIAGIQDAR